MKIFLTFMAALLISNVAVSETFNFTLTDPGSNPTECEQLVEDATVAFESATGALVVESNCVNSVGSSRYEGKISYIADKAVERTAANSGIHISSQGRFSTKEECQNQIDSDIELFTSETGLNPWFSYCGKDALERDQAWVLHIEAIGKSDVKYNVGSVPFYGKIASTRADFTAHIANKIEELGMTPVDVIVRGGMVYGYIVIHYYSAKKERLNSLENFKFPSKENCLASVDWIEEIYSNERQISAFCTNTMGKWELTQILFSGTTIKAASGIKKFDKYETCLSEESELAAKYSSKLGSRYLGGRCVFDKKIGARNFSFNYLYDNNM